MLSLTGRLFGTRNNRYLKTIAPQVRQIQSHEERLHALSDEQLLAEGARWREQLAGGTEMQSLLPEVFAAVREISQRTLGLRHFDCQMIGGIALHQGRIAEMKTGEGKTLVATLPASLNALAGRKVFLVTVNNYLAVRDADWMRPIYSGLGLKVGIVHSGQSPEDKWAAYQCDIIYATNAELGFDYLRDRMALQPTAQIQCKLDFAIVDEVDSILIDEARTPLIISGQGEQVGNMYQLTGSIIPQLQRQARENDKDNPLELDEIGDYWVDEKNRQVELTDRGHEKVEALLRRKKLLAEDENLYGPQQLKLLHFVHASLRARTLFQRDVDYIVRNREVILIDEHTGRALPGRRLSQGIHQALESKEKVPVQQESQTLASTTYQNFFRLFDTLSGMTGTAATEAVELHQIYGLEVMDIPTHLPMIRHDQDDLVYISRKEKFRAVVEHIEELHKMGRPCLVGTASIESSEYLAQLLKKQKIPHEVLNAKNHAREAEIIAQAGRPGTITIATNMAGRGTDIVLGGNWEAELAQLKKPSDEEKNKVRTEWQKRHNQVIEAGGLYVLSTERHESRRIDNQLRGRSGRQGDPGASIFFLSLEDDLIRIFAPEGVRNLIARTMGKESDEAIEAPMLTRAIARAQRRVEAHNFDIRKQLLEYDDVANEQRTIIYSHRDTLLKEEDPTETVDTFRQSVMGTTVDSLMPPGGVAEEWDIDKLEAVLKQDFGLVLPLQQWLDDDLNLQATEVRERILEAADALWQKRCADMGELAFQVERQLLLQVLDRHWKEHLAAMDQLRSGIHLRAYAQKNPRQEYKREAFALFKNLLDNFQYDATMLLMRVQLQRETPPPPPTLPRAKPPRPAPALAAPVPKQKIGRNSPCPCGSGKKYKLCCARNS